MDAAIFGLIVADLIASPVDLRHPPKPGGLTLVDSIQLTTGGNVCNTGIAMAKLGLSVAAAGLVGKDVLGVAMTERMQDSGLDTSAVFATDQAQTSATVVAVEAAGERCFFHTPGVTPLLDAEALRRCFDTFRKCSWIQIGYFGLLPNLTKDLPALLVELKRACPKSKVSLETVNPPDKWEYLQPILPHLDLFAPSRTEGEALTGLTEPTKMIEAFRKHMKTGLIGIKLDAEGCLLDDGHKQVMVPAYKIKVVDTTGAGDSWYAGLLTGLIKNMPLEKAGQFANRVAADCCTALGASTGIKSYEETIIRL